MLLASAKRPLLGSIVSLCLIVLPCCSMCKSSPTRDNPNSDVTTSLNRFSNEKRLGKAIIGESGKRVKDTTSLLRLQDLSQYKLAVCADGSPAAYYAEQREVNEDSMRKVMIYFGDENSRQDTCSSTKECLFICNMEPGRCKSPEASILRMDGGIWSRESENSPFSKYFKIYLPECSLDQFSGTRGPLTDDTRSARTSGQKHIYFHGRHIFSSVLRHLVSNFNINKAEDIILVGSGNSASGVARNCDFLADAISTVNSRTRVRCILDGPSDFMPFWIQDIMTNRSSNCGRTVKQVVEDTKFLWGRRDDESCLQKLKDNLNSTSLAEYCGIFSRSWQHVSTPMFIITSQWNGKKFDEITCGLSPEKDPNYGAYVTAWRRGMLGVIQAMSDEKPENGWFIPNCGTDGASMFLSSDESSGKNLAKENRKNVRIPLFAKPDEKRNVLQVLNTWLNNNGDVEEHQAIDILGFPNPACSSDDDSDEGSNKLRSSLNLDLRPELLLANGGEHSLISSSSLGGSDFLPLPSPRDIFAVDPVFSSRAPTTVGIGIAETPVFVDATNPAPPAPRISVHTSRKATTHRLQPVATNHNTGHVGKPGTISHLTAGQTAQILGAADGNTLHDIEEKLRANILQRKRLERQFYLDSVDNPTIGSYYPGYYNLDFGIPSPKVTTTSDLDFDVLVRQSSFGLGNLPAVLPESAIKVSNYDSRKARLWRKVYYLEYLRELYRRAYREYYRDYYYGRHK